MDINKIFQSKTFKIVIFGLGGFILALAIFWAGTQVGFRKAGFTNGWGENYFRNFGGPPPGMMDFDGRDFMMNSHGTAGSIIKVDQNTIMMKGRDNIEKTVLVLSDTTIIKGRETIKISDLKVDDQIVVLGQPDNQGQITAKLIRVFIP